MEQFKNIEDIAARVQADYNAGTTLTELQHQYTMEGYRKFNKNGSISILSTADVSHLAKAQGCTPRANRGGAKEVTRKPKVESKIILDLTNKKVENELEKAIITLQKSFDLGGYDFNDARTAALAGLAMKHLGIGMLELTDKKVKIVGSKGTTTPLWAQLYNK